MAIGSQIQAWRLSRGFSPEYLAAETGISLQALDEIEAESLDPSTGTLERLATAMKIPVAWLFAHPNAFDLLFHEPEEKDGYTEWSGPGHGTDPHRLEDGPLALCHAHGTDPER